MLIIRQDFELVEGECMQEDQVSLREFSLCVTFSELRQTILEVDAIRIKHLLCLFIWLENTS